MPNSAYTRPESSPAGLLIIDEEPAFRPGPAASRRSGRWRGPAAAGSAGGPRCHWPPRRTGDTSPPDIYTLAGHTRPCHDPAEPGDLPATASAADIPRARLSALVRAATAGGVPSCCGDRSAARRSRSTASRPSGSLSAEPPANRPGSAVRNLPRCFRIWLARLTTGLRCFEDHDGLAGPVPAGALAEDSMTPPCVSDQDRRHDRLPRCW